MVFFPKPQNQKIEKKKKGRNFIVKSHNLLTCETLDGKGNKGDMDKNLEL